MDKESRGKQAGLRLYLWWSSLPRPLIPAFRSDWSCLELLPVERDARTNIFYLHLLTFLPSGSTLYI